MVHFVHNHNHSQKVDLIMKTYSLFFLLLCLTRQCFAEPWQSLDTIAQAIQSYVEANMTFNSQDRFEVRALDSHLQLPVCDQDLTVKATAGTLKPGNNNLLVSCAGHEGWKIYSAVTIKAYKDVVVLNKSLKRGDVIHADDLGLESREISLLTAGYFADPTEVSNKQAARNMAMGSVLSNQSLQDLTLVKRGEQVHIESSSASFSISMTGIAMANGAKGELIKVKNLSSQKLIQAVVINTGLVSVNF